MRRLIGPCACVLALVTGVWFGQAHALYRSIAPAEVSDASAERVAATAWRFYVAIDTFLHTGDDSDLSKVLAPGFVDHIDQPTDEPDREELIRYLTALRETNRSLRLVPQEVMAQGDRAVARLSVAEETSGAILGIPLAGTAPWPRVEILRVDGDLIVERWGNPGGYVSSTALFSGAADPCSVGRACAGPSAPHLRIRSHGSDLQPAGPRHHHRGVGNPRSTAWP